MYLRNEDKLLFSVLAAAILFFASAIHTNVYEAEKKIKQDYGIDAELIFEKGEEPNLFERIEQERADSYNVTYSFVK